jgi:hypothetical protein
MKAKKQKLEEQIINTCLANPEISNVLRDSVLEFLDLTENLEEAEKVLNNPTTLKQMTEYGNAFGKKLKEVRDRGQVLRLDSEEHIRRLLDSLAGKGFLEDESNGYMVNNDFSSDPSCLTDQEFLLLTEISSCALEQHKEKEKNE